MTTSNVLSPRLGVTTGDRERRVVPAPGIQWRSAAAGTEMTMEGFASVFDELSLDLGGFRERIAPGAFDKVLARDPDVYLVWDHDTRRVLAGTNNGSLELRILSRGLHYHARVMPLSYAQDLKMLMESGLVRQSSFAFTVERDDWDADVSGNIFRTILEVQDLFDVTVTAQGAYPQTTSAMARTLRSFGSTALEFEREKDELRRRVAAARARLARAQALLSKKGEQYR